MLSDKNVKIITLVLFGIMGLMPFSVASAAPQASLYGGAGTKQTYQSADTPYAINKGQDRKAAARKTVHKAWRYLNKGNLTAAMEGFNQAWLLDPNNGDIYHGFAILTASRHGSPDLVNKFFQMAVSKQNLGSAVYVDYGWFLLQKGNYAAAEKFLQTSLRKNQNARNAKRNLAILYYNQRDFRKSCYWAKLAQENNDDTRRTFMRDMCQR